MLFSLLIEANSQIWDEYLHHEFVKKIGKWKFKRREFSFLSQARLYLSHPLC
ncbi:TPA: hypothetical protein ACTZY5_000753 [Campylobacter coli]